MDFGKRKTQLSGYAINRAQAELLQFKVIEKEEIDGKTFYKIVGKYQIIEQAETENDHQQGFTRDERINKLLSRIETREEGKNFTEALYETDLRRRYLNLIKEAEKA